MPGVSIQIKRWSRAEYDRAVAAGCFAPGQRVELLGGEIVVTTPQQSRHAATISLLEAALRACFGADVLIRIQMPFALDEASEPEPDVAVVPGTAWDYLDAHPQEALLIAEVSDTTLQYDRGPKKDAYARAGVPEFWIVNLQERRLEIYREPIAVGTLQAHYAQVSRLTTSDTVTPVRIAVPQRSLRIADFLP